MDKIVISHFDGHGVSTGAALARVLGTDNIITRFPDTGPRGLPNLLAALDLYNKEIHIVDIPIDVSNPRAFIEALQTAAQNAKKLVYYDHHNTDLKYMNELLESRVDVRFFNTATAMAYAIATTDPVALETAIVGVVADRDPSIVDYTSRSMIESKYLQLANTLDVLVRQDPEATAKALKNEGITYLERMAGQVDYPPYRLASRITMKERGARTILAEFTDTAGNRELGMWLPKTAEEVLRRTGMDYMVIPAAHIDPRTKQTMYTVRVVQYWLSQAPVAGRIVEALNKSLGRQMVGHDKYVSIRATSREDAEQLALRIYRELEAPASRTARLINEQTVAEAVQYDYQKIVHLLERIAEALERGATAKERQVQLIEEDIGRRRYD